MTTMPNVMNNHTPTTMSTPINNLPLKTSQTEQDIDDPMIQNVLKEFENEVASNSPPEKIYQIQAHPPPQMPEQQIQYVQPPQQQNVQPPIQDSIKYNNSTTKKIIDIEIAKRAAIITAFAYFIFSSNILQYVMRRLPESVLTHIIGKECIVNTLIIFVIFYSLMYYEIL
jgi:hypothetical protein